MKIVAVIIAVVGFVVLISVTVCQQLEISDMRNQLLEEATLGRELTTEIKALARHQSQALDILEDVNNEVNYLYKYFGVKFVQH